VIRFKVKSMIIGNYVLLDDASPNKLAREMFHY
jgi:hypothetical protein